MHQPSVHITGFYKYQKGDFTSSTNVFFQKSSFVVFNPLTNISGYLNLWGISGSFLDNLSKRGN